MTKKSDHVCPPPPTLEQLRWLPVHKRIDFNILTIIFKELISPYQPNYSGLRSSSDSRMLTTPKTNLKSSSIVFYYAVPDLWNDLP